MATRKEITWTKIIGGYVLMALIIVGLMSCQLDQIDKRLKNVEDSVATQPRTFLAVDTAVVDGDTVLVEKYIRRK